MIDVIGVVQGREVVEALLEVVVCVDRINDLEIMVRVRLGVLIVDLGEGSALFIECRAKSQRRGCSCHSSIRRGVAPSNNSRGSVSMASETLGSVSTLRKLAACRFAVSVFPQPFGP